MAIIVPTLSQRKLSNGLVCLSTIAILFSAKTINTLLSAKYGRFIFVGNPFPLSKQENEIFGSNRINFCVIEKAFAIKMVAVKMMYKVLDNTD